ncbi:MAG: hypothetical protein KGJ44_06985 [Betaproteobacteria bacterium]|nr:hypothetical protein [Betaproteobacteria bacterium]
MAHASDTALAGLRELLRQLRAVPGLTEKRPGTYYWKSQAFIHFHEEPSEGGVRLSADIKKVPGSGFDRLPVDTPEQQRRLLDEARKRARKLEDD